MHSKKNNREIVGVYQVGMAKLALLESVIVGYIDAPHVGLCLTARAEKTLHI